MESITIIMKITDAESSMIKLITVIMKITDTELTIMIKLILSKMDSIILRMIYIIGINIDRDKSNSYQNRSN